VLRCINVIHLEPTSAEATAVAESTPAPVLRNVSFELTLTLSGCVLNKSLWESLMPVQLTVKKVKGIPLVDHQAYQAMDEAFNETYVKQYCRGAYCVGIGPMGTAEIAEL